MKELLIILFLFNTLASFPMTVESKLATNIVQLDQIYQAKNESIGESSNNSIKEFISARKIKQNKMKEENYLDRLLMERFPIDSAYSTRIRESFENKYNLENIRQIHADKINQRNSLYKSMNTRVGKTYIISFKEIDHYLFGVPADTLDSFQMGDSFLYPNGIGSLNIDKINIEFENNPMEINRLFYIKVVDTLANSGSIFDLSFEKKVNDVYSDVHITTRQFRLHAPKVRIQERGNRVKIFILAKN